MEPSKNENEKWWIFFRCWMHSLVSGPVKCQWFNFIVCSFPWFPSGTGNCWKMLNICRRCERDTYKKPSFLSVVAAVEPGTRAKRTLERLSFSWSRLSSWGLAVPVSFYSICSISNMSPRPIRLQVQYQTQRKWEETLLIFVKSVLM